MTFIFQHGLRRQLPLFGPFIAVAIWYLLALSSMCKQRLRDQKRSIGYPKTSEPGTRTPVDFPFRYPDFHLC